MNRIESNWLKFREKVISAEAGESQVTDMRNSFYAGAMTILSIMEEVGNEREEIGETIMSDMYLEMGRYTLKVIEGAS